MQKIYNQKLNCKSCLWNNEECKKETNGMRCSNYFPLTEDAELDWIEEQIENERIDYKKEWSQYNRGDNF